MNKLWRKTSCYNCSNMHKLFGLGPHAGRTLNELLSREKGVGRGKHAKLAVFFYSCFLCSECNNSLAGEELVCERNWFAQKLLSYMAQGFSFQQICSPFSPIICGFLWQADRQANLCVGNYDIFRVPYSLTFQTAKSFGIDKLQAAACYDKSSSQ